MRARGIQVVQLYSILAVSKGFSVFFFVLLPIFYAQNFISADQLGSIGAVFIGMLILAAVLVAKWFHSLETRTLLQIAALGAVASSFTLFIGVSQHTLSLLFVSYALMGFMTGLAMSGVNAVIAEVTKQGERFQILAQMGMAVDVVRIVFPLIAAGTLALGSTNAVIVLVIAIAILYFFLVSSLRNAPVREAEKSLEGYKSLRKNTNFFFVLLLEFLDSFSSSQLFVFLPLLFLAKGYSLENSLLFQSFVFGGYMVGRLLVSSLAKKYSGFRAIAYAEIGMFIVIICMLAASNVWHIYFLSFALGIFARGTAPAIKAVAFDALPAAQMKKGSALHVVAGDSGSALGQFLFGLAVFWLGVQSPFFIAAAVACLIAGLSFWKSRDVLLRPQVADPLI